MTSAVMYFFQDQHTLERRGPVKTEEMMMLFASGEVSARTLVWTKGMKNWMRFEKLPELTALMVDARVSPRQQQKVTDEAESEAAGTSTSGPVDDVVAGFESRFATDPGVQWDNTPGSVRSDNEKHVQEEEEEEEEEEELQQVQHEEDAIEGDNVDEESDEVRLLREKVTQLELELASVNAESIHMRDMIEAKREREAEKELAEQGDADESDTAALAEIYDKHFMLLGHRQRILEQYCIVVDKYDGTAG